MKILSFDIEDWFHIFNPAFAGHVEKWDKLPSQVVAETEWILDFLEKNQLKATFFCLGWVAGKNPQLIKKIVENGHELAAHSYLHRKVGDISEKVFFEDTSRSINILEEITGNKITAFRAPGFSFNEHTKWAFSILHELGITEDSSLKSGLRFGKKIIPNEPFLMDVAGFSIKEFPTRTYSFLGNKIIYSGSGYFRLFPYQFVKNRFLSSEYEMSYFHPRDFDSMIHTYYKGHPILQLRYRLGTDSSKNKMNQFVKDFDFITLKEADKLIDWAHVPHLEIVE
ncbi:MAG TPA: polysaccharide deacetylase family protein [Bacteroidales bacterium]